MVSRMICEEIRQIKRRVDLTIVGGDRYPRSDPSLRLLPRRRYVAVSELHGSITICVWGVIETRDGVPRIAEAGANVHDTFAAMDLMERSIELGIPLHEAGQSAAVVTATDHLGRVEVRTFLVDEVDLGSSDSLFEESENLADAVADMVDAWSRVRETASIEMVPIRRVRAALAAYDRRWAIER
jgi:hypothetical protein